MGVYNYIPVNTHLYSKFAEVGDTYYWGVVAVVSMERNERSYPSTIIFGLIQKIKNGFNNFLYI